GGDERANDLQAAAVSLGAIGVVVGVTLAVEPSYLVRQAVYEGLSESAFADHFEDITPGGDRVSFFHTWRDEGFNVWLKQRLPRSSHAYTPPIPADLFGAPMATYDLHPIPGISAEATTPQRGIPGLWHARLPHFRMEFTPSSGDELQTEYFVD